MLSVAKSISIVNENTFYFSSFEMVSFLGNMAFESDLRHVKPEIVKRVVKAFKKMSALTT